MKQTVFPKPVLTWTLLVIALPLLAFLCVSWWERHYQALPILSTIEGWQRTTDTALACQLPLTNQDGQTTRLTGFPERIIVVNFFFTRCPLICPSIMKHVQQLHNAFANSNTIQLLSVTVDPGYDQPDILKKYAANYNADGRQWQLLTGNKTAIYRMARQSLHVTATDGDGGPTDFIHTDQLTLVDPNGNIRGYYDGTSDQSVQQLMNDLKKLQHAL